MVEKIGQNIREARKDLNLSLTQVYHLTGISRQTLSGIEKGIRSGKLMLKYLVFLKSRNVDLNQIFDVKQAMNTDQEE